MDVGGRPAPRDAPRVDLVSVPCPTKTWPACRGSPHRGGRRQRMWLGPGSPGPRRWHGHGTCQWLVRLGRPGHVPLRCRTDGPRLHPRASLGTLARWQASLAADLCRRDGPTTSAAGFCPTRLPLKREGEKPLICARVREGRIPPRKTHTRSTCALGMATSTRTQDPRDHLLSDLLGAVSERAEPKFAQGRRAVFH